MTSGARMIRSGLLQNLQKRSERPVALWEKIRSRCRRIFLKSGESRYRTFKKKFAKVAGFF
jgi:hypothetical protein